MKTLIEYILESISFVIDEHERNALVEILGFLTGNLGEDSDIKKFEKYWSILSEEERQEMNELYDLLCDDHTYPKINNRIIKNDIPILLDFLNWADENELIDIKSHEIYDVIEKLEQY